jgi:hypothetical protein
LTQSAAAGAATWDGTQYVKGEEKQPNPHALAWWSTLVAIAELIDAQEAPLNAKQTAYLRTLLFGGMGSLNDLYFDRRSLGSNADVINARLTKRREELFASFK